MPSPDPEIASKCGSMSSKPLSISAEVTRAGGCEAPLAAASGLEVASCTRRALGAGGAETLGGAATGAMGSATAAEGTAPGGGAEEGAQDDIECCASSAC